MSRLSHRGAVLAFAAVACLVVAGLAALGGVGVTTFARAVDKCARGRRVSRQFRHAT